MPWIRSSQRTGPNGSGLSVRRAERGDAAQVRVDAALAAGRPVAVDPHLGRAVGGGSERRGIELEDVDRRDSRAGCRDPPPRRTGRSRSPDPGPGGPAPGWWSGRRCRSARPRRCPSGSRRGSGAGAGPTSKVALTPKLLAGTAAVMKREGGGWKTTVPTSIRRTISSCEPLVVDLDVVVAGVVPLGVEVHVDVDPLAQQPGGSDVDLVVQAGGLEAAPAAGVGIQRERRAAVLLAESVGPDLEPGLAVEGQVGILRRRARAHCVALRDPPPRPDLRLERDAVEGHEAGGATARSRRA